MTAPRRCAFLTMDNTADWSIDADLAFAPLETLGWRCSWVPWRQSPTDWDDFDAVYLAATWDYPDHPRAFVDTLAAIERSRALLVNDLDVVRWNMQKTYLRDLQAGGASIVPTLWFSRFDEADLRGVFDRFDAETVVFKPVVGANAKHAFLVELSALAGHLHELQQAFADQAFMAQPFVQSVQTDGEYSLMYLDGEFSHAVRKLPKRGDFRVQEEHGASIAACDPAAGMREACRVALELVVSAPLYARCDLVLGNAVSGEGGNAYQIMELELIEPSLYLRMNDEAPARFAKAFDRYFNARRDVRA